MHFLHRTNSSNAPKHNFLFTTPLGVVFLETWLKSRRFHSNGEVKQEASFYCRHSANLTFWDVETKEERGKECIALEGDDVEQ